MRVIDGFAQCPVVLAVSGNYCAFWHQTVCQVRRHCPGLRGEQCWQVVETRGKKSETWRVSLGGSKRPAVRQFLLPLGEVRLTSSLNALVLEPLPFLHARQSLQRAL